MWNNRIFYDKENKCFNIHETFYNEKGEVAAFGETPVRLSNFANIDDLLGSINQIHRDVLRSHEDVLDYDMKFADWDDVNDTEKWIRYEFSLFYFDKTSTDFEFSLITFTTANSILRGRSLISFGTDTTTKKIKLNSLLFFLI